MQLASGQRFKRNVLAAIGIGALVAGVAPVSLGAAAADQSALAKARQLYNLGRFAQAAEAAETARALPSTRDAANLIAGRAMLELYRQTAAESDLASARGALGAVRPDALGQQDRVELLVGLGEALYLDDAFAPAASLFESALASSSWPVAAARERVFDWWASAIDRHAQSLDPVVRLEVYPRLLDGARAELARQPVTTSALYWHAAALVALGRTAEAYDAAQAGWIRAGFNPAEAAGVRADLDRLVREGVIPDRAREATVQDPVEVAAALRAHWERFKTAWSPR